MVEVEMPASAQVERFPRGPWTLAAGAAVACGVVALVDPTENQLTPLCPFKSLTGWWCPFCGATRAASQLLRGELASAFHYNAMFVVLLPIAAVMWVAAAFPHRFAGLDPIRRNSRAVFSVAAVAFVLFVIARNTPIAETWLRYPGD